MESDLERILLTREQIAARVQELGRRIAADLERLHFEDGGEVLIIPILTGGMIFTADLMRTLPQKLRIGIVTVSSYPGQTSESLGPSLKGSLPADLSGRHVLIVDDILDSGRTLRMLRREVEARSPRSVRSCVLLRKQKPSARALPCEYVGFEIPDEFVVGYGLDYNDYYRNLPHIGVLREAALASEAQRAAAPTT
jgi:hypoxanthine phosphoribosyltransferase